jgi:hypothetical protein
VVVRILCPVDPVLWNRLHKDFEVEESLEFQAQSDHRSQSFFRISQ